MSVRTTADVKVDEAHKAVVAAEEAFRAVVVEGCWGSNEFNTGFEEFLSRTLTKLQKLRAKFKTWRGDP